MPDYGGNIHVGREARKNTGSDVENRIAQHRDDPPIERKPSRDRTRRRANRRTHGVGGNTDVSTGRPFAWRFPF